MFGKGNDGSCRSSCLENQLLDCLRSREVWDAAFVFKEEKRSRARALLLLLLVDMTNYKLQPMDTASLFVGICASCKNDTSTLEVHTAFS